MSVAALDAEIRFLSLKGKKLTKSIFNQIEWRNCFDKDLSFVGEKYFGYVNEKDKRTLVWSDSGKLRKTNLTEYSRLGRINLTHNYTHIDIEWFLRRHAIAHDAYDDDKHRLRIDIKDEDIKQFKILTDKIDKFVSEVMEHQLYI
jgi:hypothetical protein